MSTKILNLYIIIIECAPCDRLVCAGASGAQGQEGEERHEELSTGGESREMQRGDGTDHQRRRIQETPEEARQQVSHVALSQSSSVALSQQVSPVALTQSSSVSLSQQVSPVL